MKAYANITSEDKLVHNQYIALMSVLPKYNIQHRTEVAKMLNMSDSCWAHRCGGQRLLMNIGELSVLAEKLNMTDADIISIVKGVTK